MKLNPILIKELKVRARSVHIPIFVMVYNAVLAFVGILMLMSATEQVMLEGMADAYRMKAMFLVISAFQCMMIYMVSLSVASSSFSAEKERGTLDLLLMTPVSTFEVVNGKLLSAVMTGFLFAFSSFPIVLIGTVYEGVNLSCVFLLEMLLLVLAFQVSARSMSWSILFDKTSVSVVFALLTEIVFCAGPFLLLEFMGSFLYNGYQYGTMDFPLVAVCLGFQMFNPLFLVGCFFEYVTGYGTLMDIFVWFYGIWEDGALYQWLEQYFAVGCVLCQMLLTIVLHLLNVTLLKKGRNII